MASIGHVVKGGRSAGTSVQGLGDGDLAVEGALAIGEAMVHEQTAGAEQYVWVDPHLDQSFGAPLQLAQGQVGMPLLLGVGEGEDGGGLGATVRLGGHVGSEGDFVGAGKADAFDFGQPVGVFVQDRHRSIAVAAVDPPRQMSEPVRRKLDVKIANRTGRLPGLSRLFGLLFADPPQ